MAKKTWREGGPKETWLVANDDEPGRRWFGRTVQVARQDLGLSVSELASRVGLAVGTIRAIERGGRAPSEASGLRILAELFADDEWSKGHFGAGLHAVIDPVSKNPVVVMFGAKVPGDNRTWSRERKLSGGESDPGNVIDQKMGKYLSENPGKLQEIGAALAGFGATVDAGVAYFAEPIGDESLGNVIRKLPALTNLQAIYLGKMLSIWGCVNAGNASEEMVDDMERIHRILDSFLFEE